MITAISIVTVEIQAVNRRAVIDPVLEQGRDRELVTSA
jgi:hypothetical protein